MHPIIRQFFFKQTFRLCNFIEGDLDIHGGGADLIFPHHENEIAQSESLFKKKLANSFLDAQRDDSN